MAYFPSDRGREIRKYHNKTWLALDVSGDVSDLTTWTPRPGRLAVMAKSKPTGSPSPAQAVVRAAFAAAIAGWRQRSAAERSAYESATQQLHFNMTGYNWFLRMWILELWSEVPPVEQLTGLTLWHP